MLCVVWSHGRLSCVCCTTTSVGWWVLVKPLPEFNINQIVSINTTQAALPNNGQAIGQRFQGLFRERGSGMAKVVLEDEAVKVWQEKGKPTRVGKPKKKRGGGRQPLIRLLVHHHLLRVRGQESTKSNTQ